MLTLANTSLPEFFYKWEKETPENIYLKQPINGVNKDISWRESGNQVRRMVAYLRSLNCHQKQNCHFIKKLCRMDVVRHGDYDIRPYFGAVVSNFNRRPAELCIKSCQMPSGLYWQIRRLERHETWRANGCKMHFVSVLQPDKDHVQWNDILQNFEPITDSPVPNLDDVFTIIYTSGTTGNPKGVVFDFRAFRNA